MPVIVHPVLVIIHSSLAIRSDHSPETWEARKTILEITAKTQKVPEAQQVPRSSAGAPKPRKCPKPSRCSEARQVPRNPENAPVEAHKFPQKQLVEVFFLKRKKTVITISNEKILMCAIFSR